MSRPIVLFAFSLLFAGMAAGNTYTVDSTADDGAGSLRQAITDANSNPGEDTIVFALGAGAHTITLTTGQLEITGPVTIDPPADQQITIDGNANARVLRISGSGSGAVVLQDLCIRNGSSVGTGGGIKVEGANTVAQIRRCEFFQNTADDNDGGGLAIGKDGEDGPEATIVNCLFQENTSRAGGAVLIESGDTIFRGCTFDRNDSTINGSALRNGYSDAFIDTSCVNCTFTGNTSASNRGVISGEADVLLESCTITANVGALSTPIGNGAKLRNCVVAANDFPGGDVKGEPVNLGNNFIGANDSTSFTDGVDSCIVGTLALPIDPMLGAIGDFGGQTPVHYPLPGSPLIDQGNDAAITAPLFTGTPFKDQLGMARIVGATTDIGAVEFNDSIVVTNNNSSGPGSFAQAIADAALAGSGTITFDPVIFDNNLLTIEFTAQQVIDSDLRILGPVGGVILDGLDSVRLFDIDAGVVELQGMRLIRGNTTGSGGAIHIDSAATVLLRDCTLAQNHAGANGGAIYLGAATLTLLNCTLSNNDCGANGGALNSNVDATLRLLNSTLSGNSAVNHGGGLFANSSDNRVINCTVTNNTANSDADVAGDGGGIRRGLGGTTIFEIGNTIVAGNDDLSFQMINAHSDISGEFTSFGHNFIGKSTGATGLTDGISGDQVGTTGSPIDPLLDPLSNNGGNTRTHALLSGSPAEDGGDNNLLNDPAWPNGPPTNDQRGSARFGGSRIDIGSFEVSAPINSISFDDWVSLNGLTGADALPEAIPHVDGVANLLKYAFDLDGTGPDRQVQGPGQLGLPLITAIPSGADIVLSIEYVRRIGANASYTAMKSGDLESWTPLLGSELLSPVDAEWERITISESFDPAVDGRQFGAVQVTLIE